MPKNVDNPLNEKELDIVKRAINAINLESIQKKIETISESQTLLGSEGKILSSDKNFIASITEKGQIQIINQNSKQVLKTIGTESTVENKPYNLQIKENGNIFIINKNNDKVWTTQTGSKGTPPFKLELSNDGKLILKNSKEEEIWKI